MKTNEKREPLDVVCSNRHRPIPTAHVDTCQLNETVRSDISSQLVLVKAHLATPDLADRAGEGPEERKVVDIEVRRLRPSATRLLRTPRP